MPVVAPEIASSHDTQSLNGSLSVQCLAQNDSVVFNKLRYFIVLFRHPRA